MIKFSIITVCLNAGNDLLETVLFYRHPHRLYILHIDLFYKLFSLLNLLLFAQDDENINHFDFLFKTI